jgi:hypothetical protein
MLKIQDSQLDVFRQQALGRYVAELVEHCRKFAPDLCGTLDDAQLERAVRIGIEQARVDGFNERGPVRFYLDLMIVFGAGFARDPQYPWIAKILAGSGSQLERTEVLHTRVAVYLAEVDGKDNVYTLAALRELSRLVRMGLNLSPEGLHDELLALMTEIHPRKAAQADPGALRRLIAQAEVTARTRYGFRATRSYALFAVMMFAFGHAFDSDPFLPWIAKTLTAKRDSKNPDEAAQRLERRALTWLEAVLKNAAQRA